MKSTNRDTVNVQDNKSKAAINRNNENRNNNEIGSGNVGAQGGDNGASTLRELRKKQGGSAK